MTLYTCECGKTKELSKATIVYRDGKWVAKGSRMLNVVFIWIAYQQKAYQHLQRTEPSLTKRRDKLWEGAKEKLVGSRGINESFD